jgi:hypothetical protein
VVNNVFTLTGTMGDSGIVQFDSIQGEKPYTFLLLWVWDTSVAPPFLPCVWDVAYICQFNICAKHTSCVHAVHAACIAVYASKHVDRFQTMQLLYFMQLLHIGVMPSFRLCPLCNEWLCRTLWQLLQQSQVIPRIALMLPPLLLLLLLLLLQIPTLKV